ncbi:MAG: MBL fold metallo-hydrolase RNA specificity domain-containing protein [Nanoarchaeota archaeon]
MLKIHAVGGFSEVGKNMTAVESRDDVTLCDAGLFIPALVGVSEREKVPTEQGMRSIGALPNDHYLDEKKLRDKVRSIAVSHAHLDHVGAVQYLAHRYKAGIYGTPYTMEVLKNLLPERGLPAGNKMHTVKSNGIAQINGKNKYKVEFINMTHSTLQCALVAVHTPDGVVLYANDYKLDNTPVIGDKPNYKRLKEISKEGVKALVVNCLYAHSEKKTPSEQVARDMVRDTMSSLQGNKEGLIVTTFASHIARLKSIVDFGQKLDRKIVFIGRSLAKYVLAGESINQVPFKSKIIMATYKKQLEKTLRQVDANRDKYLVVCTGHQGEKGSVLDRMSRNQLPLRIQPGDNIVFCSKTIPAPETIASRSELMRRLDEFKPRIHDNLHVSGHGSKEDLMELIKLTNPENVIPSHGDHAKTIPGMHVAEEMGYKKGYNVHLLSNGESIKVA